MIQLRYYGALFLASSLLIQEVESMERPPAPRPKGGSLQSIVQTASDYRDNAHQLRERMEEEANSSLVDTIGKELNEGLGDIAGAFKSLFGSKSPSRQQTSPPPQSSRASAPVVDPFENIKTGLAGLNSQFANLKNCKPEEFRAKALDLFAQQTRLILQGSRTASELGNIDMVMSFSQLAINTEARMKRLNLLPGETAPARVPPHSAKPAPFVSLEQSQEFKSRQQRQELIDQYNFRLRLCGAGAACSLLLLTTFGFTPKNVISPTTASYLLEAGFLTGAGYYGYKKMDLVKVPNAVPGAAPKLIEKR